MYVNNLFNEKIHVRFSSCEKKFDIIKSSKDPTFFVAGLLLTTKNRIRLSPKICQRWTQEPFFG